MLKKIVAIIAITAMAVSLNACSKKKSDSDNIVNKTTETTKKTQTKELSDTIPAPATNSSEETPAPTFAPAATMIPGSETQADEKVAAVSGSNAYVKESSGSLREVNLEFELINSTGIDFPGLLIEPVNLNLTQGVNRFPEGFLFENGMSITLSPMATADNGDSSAYTFETTMFNIAALDAEGRGYVFQNIDLSINKSIELTLDNGVPKAIIN